MPTLTLPIGVIDQDSLAQLDYALSFVSEHVAAHRLDTATQTILVDFSPEEVRPELTAKVQELVGRYQRQEFGLAKKVHYQHQRATTEIDAWQGLVDRRWITEVGQGHVILRGAAAKLYSLIDAKVDRLFAQAFGSEREYYPNTIRAQTLDRTHHFTSFPEHIDFVAHLQPELGVINAFAQDCKTGGWAPERHRDRMGEHDFAICPSCCYHCYEGMEGWDVPQPGRSITSLLACHRYEAKNHRTLSRLRAFSMREVIWVGTPRFVIESRAKADALIIQWAKDWELDCSFETANDMFFTEDYAVKASFQRQQQAKNELRVRIPQEKQAISVFSSNFHAMTFGKAFNITSGGRPATSGCIGWGYERWIYALFSQFGFDLQQWPSLLREEYVAHTGQNELT